MKTRLVFYTETYAVGGAERFLFDLMNHLDRDRYELSFWCNDYPALHAAVQQRVVPHPELKVMPLLSPVTTRLTHLAQQQVTSQPASPSRTRQWLNAGLRYIYLVTALVSLRRLLVQARPDILHVNNGGYPGAQSARAAILAAAQVNIPSRIMTVHNLAFPYAPVQTIEKWLDRRVEQAATQIVSASLAVGEALARERGFKPEAITNVHLGLTETPPQTEAAARCRAEIGLPDSARLVGVVASFEPRKGHAHFIRALAQVVSSLPSVRAVLVGSGGGNEANIRRMVDDLGLTRHVFFLGRRSDVLAWMTACEVVVLPSTGSEGYGYVILEAMSMGKPVIGTQVGGVPESIEHEATGLVVPPADAETLAAAMLKVLTDPVLAGQMGQTGRERVRNLFSLESMVKIMTTLYERDLLTAASR